MRRLFPWLALSLLLVGCSLSPPAAQITSTFRSFLQSVKTDDEKGIMATAPFLGGLSAEKRQAVVQSFQRLALDAPRKLTLSVSKGPDKSYLLRVSLPGKPGAVLVPFHRDAAGRWQIVPTLKGVQRIKVVARR